MLKAPPWLFSAESDGGDGSTASGCLCSSNGGGDMFGGGGGIAPAYELYSRWGGVTPFPSSGSAIRPPRW